jgi:ubiquinone/menaquinone biosynthesis C-methylase UbiE
MGLYQDQILPRVIDKVLDNAETRRLRTRYVAGVEGVVLEIGFGSGLNVPHYPTSVSRVLAVDPATVGRKLAQGRIDERGVDVAFVGLDGASIPVDDASVDSVLSTFTLCTIPDVDRALSEIRRVLRPGGRFHFLEHGRSPDPRVARRQDRFNPMQKVVAGGCNMNRSIDVLVERAGFELESLEHPPMRGPKAQSYMYAGVASPA